MEYDTGRAKEKADELIDIAKEAIVSYSKSAGFKLDPRETLNIAAKIIDNYVDFTPPEVDVTPPEKEAVVLELITMRTDGRGEVRSVKPGNVFLNINKLMAAIATASLAVISAITVPWTAPLAALIIWDRVWSRLKVQLSEREAAIIWTMWTNKDDNRLVSDVDLLDKVNSELAKHGRGSISRQELDDALETLKNMACIQRSESEPSKWWLREGVKVSYR